MANKQDLIAKVAEATELTKKEGVAVFDRITKELKEIMEEKGYETLEDFRGKLHYIDQSTKKVWKVFQTFLLFDEDSLIRQDHHRHVHPSLQKDPCPLSQLEDVS